MGAEATTGRGHVIGRYVLYDEIAAGGMATIHIARLLGDISGFSRTVAVKRLLPQFARDIEFVNMFLEEARLAARIRHANVVQVLDVVREENELFLVMEFIQGETITRLTRVNRQRARIVPMPIALAIMVDALQGLHAAHEAKDETGKPLEIVHRDISPHNIMVGHDGRARVLDFGIAKASSSSQSTREGEVKGKFAYMSPEQLSSASVDRRADVFAASIVLWEMISGQRLFQAPDPAAIVGRVLTMPIKKPSEIAPGLPPALDEIVLKGLARDADQRFASALEMARAVETSGLPIARATEVAAWVNRIAGDTLKKRAKRIAEIESTGSWSASNALAATAEISQPQIDNTGSNSRSAIRPRSDPWASAPYPATSSQQLPAQDVDIPIDVPKKRSKAGLVFFLLLLGAGAGAGVFVWRSGGVRPAKEKIAKIFRTPEPHGTPVAITLSASSSAKAEESAQPVVHATDITDSTSAPSASTGPGKIHTHVRTHYAGHVGHASPTATEEDTEPAPTATAEPQHVAPTGPVPARPTIGQVQAAIVPLMATAKACFSPDSPPTRANVTFQSDGSVKSVGVSGFAAGKPQESCVRSTFAKARVDPFSDPTYSLPVTVRP